MRSSRSGRGLGALLRCQAARARRVTADVMRIWRALTAPPRRVVVGYTRTHTVYTDVFDVPSLEEFVMYRRTPRRWLALLDRLAWRRVRVLHQDASTPRDPALQVPVVVACEGRPRAEFFSDPTVARVLVWSRWAGGEYVHDGRATLLRPSIPLPRLRERRRRPGDPIVLVAVGYTGIVKGFDVVMRVYDALRREFPLRLVIAGTFDHNFEWYPEITPASYARMNVGALEAQLRADPNVRFGLIPREELMAAVYPAADVYLHASRMETFGHSILEAMSHALPVVATRINAIPEMVRHGETGFLADTGGLDINGDAWADRVTGQMLDYTRRLLASESLRAEMGLAGRRRVASAFDVHYSRRAHARVFREALQGASRAAAPRTARPALRPVETS